MSKKTVLFADASCDLSQDLIDKYNVQLTVSDLSIDGVNYIDNVTITPPEMFEIYRKTKKLPKTAAINTERYLEHFDPWLNDGYEIVMINIGSGISACHQNALNAASEREGLYPVDSKNLSTGIGHLVIEAGELIQQGVPAKEVAERIEAMVPLVHSSFVLDTLEFMRAGGRCSAIAAFGANLLGLKPSIEVDTSTGKLGVAKKYRGTLLKALPEYVRDQLTRYDSIRTDKIFITYSSATPEMIELVKKTINDIIPFEKVYTTTASCNISSHCGPGTLGILFMTEN